MKRLLATLLLLAAVLPCTAQQITDNAKERAARLVAGMTLDEKLAYIGGHNAFHIRAVERLGIPKIRMADGPQCVRNDSRSTLYPCGIALAATWNRDMAHAYGRSLGRDARARGVHIMLGPGVNIYRSPLCGRNFEYMGEDPYLASEMAAEYIKGMQGEGVMATIKHFCGNNEEYDRHHTSSDIDERTLHEIYLATFRKAVIEANVGAVMASYNLVNGRHMSENGELNVGVLRDKWGFEGILMSDWDSVYSTLGPVNNGLDIEMPSARYTNPEAVKRLIATGVVDERTIDEKCRHILQTLIAFGFLDREQRDAEIPERDPESEKVALEVAREAVVLLKNDGLLPLTRKTRNVVVVGPNANKLVMGGGSGTGNPIHYTTIAKELQKTKTLNVTSLTPEGRTELTDFYTHDGTEGLRGQYFPNRNFEGEPLLTRTDKSIDFFWSGAPAEGLPADGFSVRWTGVFRPKLSGRMLFEVTGDDGYRLFVDGREIVEHWSDHSASSRTAAFNVEQGRSYDIRLEFYENASEATVVFKHARTNPDAVAVQIALADAVVYCAGFDRATESEGFDRTFQLPAGQAADIALTASLNPNTVLVINSGGGVDLSIFEDKVRAIVMAWYPGQEGGTAVADILTGRVNPSGRLPISIERRWEDNPVRHSYYPNVEPFNRTPHRRISYDEGLFVGYRGYDRNGVEPLYPFGHGLSYTSFAYSDLEVAPTQEGGMSVRFTLRNSGRVAGKEVAQVYIGEVSPELPRPIRELKGCEKIELQAGERRRVEIILPREAFAHYDARLHDFVEGRGDFRIHVGGSSRNLPLETTVTLR